MDVINYILSKKLKKYVDDSVGNVSDEKISEAVNNYLEENPVAPGATSEQAEQIQDNTNKITELKGDLDTLNQGGLVLKDAYITQKIQEDLANHPEWTTTVQDKSLTIDKMVIGTLGYVTPQMFGAKGDGTSDDTESFKQAINSGIKKIFVPNGLYRILNVEINVNGIELYGSEQSIIGIFDTNASQYDSPLRLNNVDGCYIHDLIFDNTCLDGSIKGNPSTGYRNLAFWGDLSNLVFERVTFRNNGHVAVAIAGTCKNVLFDTCIWSNVDSCINGSGWYDILDRFTVRNCVMKSDGNSNSEYVVFTNSKNIIIENSYFSGKTNGNGIMIVSCNDVYIGNCTIKNSGRGLQITGSTHAYWSEDNKDFIGNNNITVYNCFFGENTYRDIEIEGPIRKLTIENNKFSKGHYHNIFYMDYERLIDDVNIPNEIYLENIRILGNYVEEGNLELNTSNKKAIVCICRNFYIDNVDKIGFRGLMFDENFSSKIEIYKALTVYFYNCKNVDNVCIISKKSIPISLTGFSNNVTADALKKDVKAYCKNPCFITNDGIKRGNLYVEKGQFICDHSLNLFGFVSENGITPGIIKTWSRLTEYSYIDYSFRIIAINNNAYVLVQPGTSGENPPSETEGHGNITDGSCIWAYIGKVAVIKKVNNLSNYTIA